VAVDIPKKLRLQALCWVARQHEHISREIVWLSVRTDWILDFKDQMEMEKGHKISEVEFPKATASALRNPAKLKEKMIASLKLVRTADGVKLSYAVCERLIAVAGETFGHDDSPYDSHDGELTNRYPIITGELGFDATQTADQMTELEKVGPFMAKYLRDREVVFNLLNDSFNGLDIWNHATDIGPVLRYSLGFFYPINGDSHL